MKAYILTDEDIRSLLMALDRDPERGINGGSSVLGNAEKDAHRDAHRFYNYQIHKWLADIGAE
jgi:hypothetical protein